MWHDGTENTGSGALTVRFHALGNHLKAHHSEVVLHLPLHLLPVVVEDEGEVVVQVELQRAGTGRDGQGQRANRAIGHMKKETTAPAARANNERIWSSSRCSVHLIINQWNKKTLRIVMTATPKATTVQFYWTGTHHSNCRAKTSLQVPCCSLWSPVCSRAQTEHPSPSLSWGPPHLRPLCWGSTPDASPLAGYPQSWQHTNKSKNIQTRKRRMF